MDVPASIQNIIQRIVESEEEWKALFMARWGLPKYWLKPWFQCIYPENWETPIQLGLPASKRGGQQFTPKRLTEILESKDLEFTLSHLQTLFSLFEELLTEVSLSEILFNEGLKNFGMWPNMENFFKLPNTNDILSEQEIGELKLAKITRNCYIHNGSEIDTAWLTAYRGARGIPTVTLGDGLEKGFPNLFHQIEDWNEFIINISKKIQEKIIKK